METTTNKPVWYVASEVELIYKSKVKPSERPMISSSKCVFDLLMKTWNLDRIDFVEEFKVLFLNRSNKVLGIFELALGGLTEVVADPRIVFAAALKANALQLILVHNHPSGNLKPSQPDVDLTNKIKHAGKFLDILVADHLIITSEGYYSFADDGLL